MFAPMRPRPIIPSCINVLLTDASKATVSGDQGVRARVVGQCRVFGGIELGDDARFASTLPSSTPHWSKESICQIVPWVNTLCSYSATSWPSTRGVSSVGQDRRRRMVAGEGPMRQPGPRGRLPPRTSAARLAEGERLGLGEEVGHEQVLVVTDARGLAGRTR